MKAVTGYMTNDGVFFESAEEAAVHEAEEALKNRLVHLKINPEKFIWVLETLAYEVETYIDAYKSAVQNSSAERGGEEAAWTPLGQRPGDYIGTEEELASLLQQPVDGHSDVSDVGSGSRSEEVSDRREVDGSGSRRVDAPGIRSGETLAAKRGAGTSRTRKGKRPEDFGKDALD